MHINLENAGIYARIYGILSYHDDEDHDGNDRDDDDTRWVLGLRGFQFYAVLRSN